MNWRRSTTRKPRSITAWAAEQVQDGNHEAAARHARVAHGHSMHAFEHASHATLGEAIL